MRRALVVTLLFATVSCLAQVQQAPKTAQLSPVARIRAAKTAYVKNGGGSDFPYHLFESSVEGWGRFKVVSKPEQADIVIEVTSPTEDSGLSVSSSTTPSTPLGGSSSEQSIKTSKQLSVQRIVLTVYDGHSNVRLWTAVERPKGAFKQKAKEDNLADATQSLFSKFKELVEPPPAQ